MGVGGAGGERMLGTAHHPACMCRIAALDPAAETPPGPAAGLLIHAMWETRKLRLSICTLALRFSCEVFAVLRRVARIPDRDISRIRRAGRLSKDMWVLAALLNSASARERIAAFARVAPSLIEADAVELNMGTVVLGEYSFDLEHGLALLWRKYTQDLPFPRIYATPVLPLVPRSNGRPPPEDDTVEFHRAYAAAKEQARADAAAEIGALAAALGEARERLAAMGAPDTSARAGIVIDARRLSQAERALDTALERVEEGNRVAAVLSADLARANARNSVSPAASPPRCKRSPVPVPTESEFVASFFT